MAVKTLYFKDAVPSGATLHRSLQDGGVAPTAATTTTGWNPGTNVLGQSCLQKGGTEVARGDATWGATLQPVTGLSQTVGDGWRSENAISGTFANTNWSFAFQVRSVTAAYAGRFKLGIRVYRSTDANGVGATEITSARTTSSATAASLTTSADTGVTVTWTPGATMTFNNEYLFVQVGVEITSAGSATTQDIDFRVGSTAAITTPDFLLEATPPVGSLALAGIAPSAVGGQVIAPSVGALAASGAAPVEVSGTIISPAVGALSASGVAPSVVRANTITPSAGALSVSGVAANAIVPVIITPAAGALSLTGSSAGAVAGTVVTPDAGGLSVASDAPTVTLSGSGIIFYLLPDALASGANACGSMQDGGSAPASADSASGWVVGTTSTGMYCMYNRGVKRLAAAFTNGEIPSIGVIDDTNGAALRSQNAYTGLFSAGAWAFTFAMRSTVAGGTTVAADAINFRLFKSTDPTGQTGLVELTGNNHPITTSSATCNTSEQTVFATLNPGNFYCNGEYIFVSVAMKTTTNGSGAGATNDDWLLRTGNSQIITPTFTSLAKAYFFLPDSVASGANACAAMQDGGTPPATATAVTGWKQGTTAANRYSPMKAGVEQLATTFTTTVVPSATIDDVNGNAFRTPAALTGVFAAASWSFFFNLLPNANNGQDIALRVRVFRSTDPTGQTSLVELTSATQQSASVPATAPTVAKAATVTWTPGSTISLTGEYLFFSVAATNTGAGSLANSTFDFVVGSAAYLQTPDFTSTAPPSSGSLTLAGTSPALSITQLVTTAAGAASMAGSAPAVVAGRNITPGAGALAVSGVAPTSTITALFVPSAGSIAASGAAPTIVRQDTIAPSPGALSLSGVASTAVVNQLPSPAAGALTVAGVAPSAVRGLVITPSAGSLTIAGVSATRIVDSARGPAVGSLSISGAAPATVQNFNLTPGAGSLSSASSAPSLDLAIKPNAGSLALAAAAPTVTRTGGPAQWWIDFLIRGDGSQWGALDTSAPGGTNTTTVGWTINTGNALYSPLSTIGGATGTGTQPTTSFGATVLPGATVDNTTWNAFRSFPDLTGHFYNGTWTFTFKMISTTVGSPTPAIVALRLRVFKSSDSTGQTGLTELTAAPLQSNDVTASLAEQTATVTWTPGASFDFLNEYLFFGVALVTRNASSASNIFFRTADGSNVITADFQQQAVITTGTGKFEIPAPPNGGAQPVIVRGTAITPSVGALSASGIVATVVLATSISPTAGSMSTSGNAATATQNALPAPTAGALAISGVAANAIAGRSITPSTGAVAATGVQASVTRNSSISASAGAATLTGVAPTTETHFIISPSAGSLAFSGGQPTLVKAVTITPGAGSAALVGHTATAQGNGSPPVTGELSFVNFEPIISRQDTISPGCGSIAATGVAPSSQVDLPRTPGAGAMGLSDDPSTTDSGLLTGAAAAAFVGAAPVLVFGTVAKPSTGSVSLSSAAQEVDFGGVVSPAAGAATLLGSSAVAVRGAVVPPDAADVAIAGAQPVLVMGSVAYPASGALQASGVSVAEFLSVNIVSQPQYIVITGKAPLITQGRIATPGSGSMSIASAAPSLFLNYIFKASTGSASFLGAAPVLVPGLGVVPAAGHLVATGAAPALKFNFSIAPAAAALVVTGVTPVRSSGAVATPGSASLTATGYAPLESSVAAVVPQVAHASLTGQAPTLVRGSVAAPRAGSIAATGAIPVQVQGMRLVPAAGAVQAVGGGAGAIAGRTTTPAAGQLSATGAQAVEERSNVRVPGAGAVSAAGSAPVLSYRFAITPPSGALTLSGGAARSSQNETVIVGPGGLSIAASAPTAGIDKPITPHTGHMVIAGQLAIRKTLVVKQFKLVGGLNEYKLVGASDPAEPTVFTLERDATIFNLVKD